jgi:hypothetical protein
MATDGDPVVGNWYQHLDKGQEFQVVAIDEESEVVEIQHFDGDVDEVELDAWYAMDLEAIEPPEDWTGPIDDIEKDDLGYSDPQSESDDWPQPAGAATIPRDLDEGELEEVEEWGEEEDGEEPWEDETY